MRDQMTYREARKLNAIFLLLLLATESVSPSENSTTESERNDRKLTSPSSEYLDEKLQEFEREKYRF